MDRWRPACGRAGKGRDLLHRLRAEAPHQLPALPLHALRACPLHPPRLYHAGGRPLPRAAVFSRREWRAGIGVAVDRLHAHCLMLHIAPHCVTPVPRASHCVTLELWNGLFRSSTPGAVPIHRFDVNFLPLWWTTRAGPRQGKLPGCPKRAAGLRVLEAYVFVCPGNCGPGRGGYHFTVCCILQGDSELYKIRLKNVAK